MAENPVISRVFDAPKEKVWKAWTEAEQIKKWWGPKDFTAPEIKIDLRPGGKYVYCMRGPAGTEFDTDMYSGGVIKEVVPEEKIVLTDSFTDKDGNKVPPADYGMEGMPDEMEVTVTFEDAGEGKTKLTIAYAASIPEQYSDDMLTGWNQSLDKLAESLR